MVKNMNYNEVTEGGTTGKEIVAEAGPNPSLSLNPSVHDSAGFLAVWNSGKVTEQDPLGPSQDRAPPMSVCLLFVVKF